MVWLTAAQQPSNNKFTISLPAEGSLCNLQTWTRVNQLSAMENSTAN